MKSLFLAESPLQLISAAAARKRFGESCDDVLVIKYGDSSRSVNNQHLRQVEKLFSDVKIIRLYSSKNRVLTSLKEMFLYIRMLSIRGVPNIFIGEFRSVWMHRCLEILNSKHAYLLDDGIIIVDIFNQYLSKGIYKPNFKISRYNVLNLLYGFLCFATGSAKGVPYRLTMCTAFPFEKLGCSEQLFIKNDYTSSLFSGEFKDDDSVFYYFGTKYSEAGYFSMEVEILFLNRVFDYLRKKGFKIVYVAHRDDAKNKLDLIESVGVEVQRFDCPAELHFFRKGSAPKYIGGAFSTAVINIKLIFNSEFVVFFKLPISDVSRNKIDQVIDVYDFYNRIGFDVIDLWEDDPVKVREGLNNR